MALKVDYVVKETATNLRRNLTLTFVTVVTIALTLTTVGAFFLTKAGLDRANVQFKGSVSLIVFMKPDAPQAQIDAVGRSLDQTPQVKSKRYLDHDAAFAEFKEVFADKPELTNGIAPADVPTSYKVTLKDGSSDVVLALKSEYEGQPGVLQVSAAAAAVKTQEQAFDTIRKVLLVIAIIVGISSLVLITNSIRIAMFARRREIEVMKLVGATNWFIRVPFMAEGMVQGLIGAAVGIAVVAGLKAWLLPPLVKAGGTFNGFRVTGHDVLSASIYMVIGGAVVGVFASAVAATRYLDV